jgi:hypothetical protein
MEPVTKFGKAVKPYERHALKRCCIDHEHKNGSLLVELDYEGNVIKIGEQEFINHGRIRSKKFMLRTNRIRNLKDPSIRISFSRKLKPLYPFGYHRAFGSKPLHAVTVVTGDNGLTDFYYGHVTQFGNDHVKFKNCIDGQSHTVEIDKVAIFRYQDDEKLQFISERCKVKEDVNQKLKGKLEANISTLSTKKSDKTNHGENDEDDEETDVGDYLGEYFGAEFEDDDEEDEESSIGKYLKLPNGNDGCEYIKKFHRLDRGGVLFLAKNPQLTENVKTRCATEVNLEEALRNPTDEKIWRSFLEESTYPGNNECSNAVGRYITDTREGSCKNNQKCSIQDKDCLRLYSRQV